MASPKKRRGRDLLQFIAYSVIAGFLVAVIVVPPVVGAGSVVNASMSWFQDLPDEISEGPLARPSTIYAADGKTELATFYEENRTQVKLDQISPHMRNAIISVEDRDFYSHGAVSAVGIGRAFFNNAMNPGKRQGASTLTQQYVNNLIVNAAEQNGEDANATLGGNKNYFAKIKEMKLAVSMEQNKSKDEILEGYLNIVNMGGSNFGVEAAAQYYWGIPAKDLNVAQSALLAGLVQSPNTYRPDEHPDNAVERRNVVLSTMLRDGKISQQEYDEAVASEVNLDIHPVKKGCSNAGEYAFFCNYVVNNILQDESYGATDIQRNAMLQRGGLKIYTSLSTEAQKVAKQAVESTQPGATNTNDINTALTSIEPSNGNVVAMAQNTEWGSPKDANDHSVSQFNYNVDAKYGGTNGFQPGSTFKPVILAQWIKDGKGVNGMVNGTQLSYPTSFAWNAKCYDETGGKYYYRNQPEGWTFKNAVNGGLGYNTAAYGIRQSLNSYLYGMLSRLDLCDVHEMSKTLHMYDGTGEPLHSIPDLGTDIGGTKNGVSPLTLASAYAVFANEGKYCEPRPMNKVTKNNGEVFKEYQAKCEQVLDPDIANGVSWVLKGVIQQGGSASTRGIGLPEGSAAKTGTNDNSSQTWIAGYTRGLVTTSWVGNVAKGFRSMNGLAINGQVREYVDGATYAGAQWQTYMKAVAPKYNTDNFTQPSAKVLSTAN